MPTNVFTKEAPVNLTTCGLDGRKIWENTPDVPGFSSTSCLPMKLRHNAYAQPTAGSPSFRHTIRTASNDVRFEVLRCHGSLSMVTRNVHFPHRTGTAQETMLMYGLTSEDVLKQRIRDLDSRKTWESIGYALT